MIQILGLRSFTPKNGQLVTFDKLFSIGTKIESVAWLFENIDKVLAEIPENEHWNLFYTIANCGTEKRDFEYLQTVAFDIDGIDHEKGLEKYIDVICKEVSLPKDGVGIVSSGNGLHILAHLSKRQGKEFFKREKPHYKALCGKINAALASCQLPGNADTAVFEPRRILRLPKTVNRKAGKAEKKCVLVQNSTRKLDWKPSDYSGLPVVAKDEQVDKASLKRYPRTDTPAVMNECLFLKSCADNPGLINEPQWYAALSIVARLDGGGPDMCHKISAGHPGYSKEETDLKIEQALTASGPRTCDSISQIWDGCTGCPHYQKVESPIRIVGENHIKTEFTGFYNEIYDSRGNPKFVPAYEDLVKFFKKETEFRNLGDSRLVYVWKDTHYKLMEKASLEAYARTHFDPTPDMKICEEWRKRVSIANIYPIDWWDKSHDRKMNFKNGYLDIDTMDFRPHDREIAFRNVLPYDYDPHAKAPTFEKMLRMVTGDDPETIAVLEEFIGYSLSNDTCWAQKVLVLTGEGSNGKSTFVDTLKEIAGRGNYSSISMDKIDDQYNLATLDGKLFNISEETSPKAFKNNATFKNLATGGSFMVRMIYKEPYELTNRAKQILTCNALPDSTDSTQGFYRRLLIVPFNQTIDRSHPDFDPFILDKLKKELSGIFNIAMRGYQRLVKNRRFTDAGQMKDTLDQYRLENDTVLYWVKEHLVVHTNGGFDQHASTIGDLYAAYRDAMKAMSRIPVHEQKFCRQLSKLRGDVWGDHPYPQRVVRRVIQVNGRPVKVRMLQGVEINPVN